MPTLYEDADLYDLVAPQDSVMEHFYVERAGGPGRHMLELACGSGRFTAPLVASGAKVTGGDLARPMIEQAQRALRNKGLSAELLQIDMRDFAFGRQFDAVVIAANSLMHLHSNDEFKRAFASIRKHLRPGGILAFDIFVPSARLLSCPTEQRQLLGTFNHPQLGSVTVEETVDYDPTTQISLAIWYWSTSNARDFRQTQLELRQIYPQEQPLLLALGGLQLVERYGGFDNRPFDRQCHRQVCIATAA